MILADKITDLRKKNGWSQEELAEMLDVSRQSISKWESAQSTPDMNRILKMSKLFGVSTDYLLKDDAVLQAIDPLPEETVSVHTVSMEEASAFLSFKTFSAGRIALGVMLCVLSPVLLIALGALREGGIFRLSEAAAAGMGLAALLLLIGAAVPLFLTTGLAGQKYEYLEKEEIDTAYGVDGMVKEKREKYRPTFSARLVTGILLCVLSYVPLFLSMIFFGENSMAQGLAVSLLLVMVAVGCLLIVNTSIIWGGFQMLLQEGKYTPKAKAENKKNEPLAVIYWCSVTAIFLAVSFLTNAWHRSWIIWPVAGVAYAVVMAVVKVLKKNQ